MVNTELEFRRQSFCLPNSIVTWVRLKKKTTGYYQKLRRKKSLKKIRLLSVIREKIIRKKKKKLGYYQKEEKIEKKVTRSRFEPTAFG